MKEKTYVEDVSRSIYDIKNDERDTYRVKQGLTTEIVEQISREKTILCGWSCFVCDPCKFIMKRRCQTGAPI